MTSLFVCIFAFGAIGMAMELIPLAIQSAFHVIDYISRENNHAYHIR